VLLTPAGLQSAAEHKAKGNEFFQKEKFAEVLSPNA